MSNKVSKSIHKLPKLKPNHFFVYKNNVYNEIPYLTQLELSENWHQVIPKYSNKFINNYSITLAHLPTHLWCKLVKEIKNDNEVYKIIKDGITHYSIIETNQDNIMINIYNEINKEYPDVNLLKQYITELDSSQYNSWLILCASRYIEKGYLYEPNYVTELTVPVKVN